MFIRFVYVLLITIGSINSFEQAASWLRIFAADIYARLVEEGVLEHKRRPKSINLHHRQGAQTRSKQAPIPTGKMINEDVLFDLAKNLMAQVIVDGRAWPCANLSLSVAGFEEGPTGNRGIGGFLVKGEEAKALQAVPRGPEDDSAGAETVPPAKRRRTEPQSGRINSFFQSHDSSIEDETDNVDFDQVPSAQPVAASIDESIPSVPPHLSPPATARTESQEPLACSFSNQKTGNEEVDVSKPPDLARNTTPEYLCERCQKTISLELQSEHDDWHFARDLQQQEQSRPVQVQQPPRPATPHRPSKPARGRGRPPRGGLSSHDERGQSKLAFG